MKRFTLEYKRIIYKPRKEGEDEKGGLCDEIVDRFSLKLNRFIRKYYE